MTFYFPSPPAMDALVSELGVLLKMLDQENLSSSTQEKKTSVWNLLQQIQPSGQKNEQKHKNWVNTSVVWCSNWIMSALKKKFLRCINKRNSDVIQV